MLSIFSMHQLILNIFIYNFTSDPKEIKLNNDSVGKAICPGLLFKFSHFVYTSF